MDSFTCMGGSVEFVVDASLQNHEVEKLLSHVEICHSLQL